MQARIRIRIGYVYVLAGQPPLAGTVFENTVPDKLYTTYQYHSFKLYCSTLSCSNIMHARALTCCMAWRTHLLHASESQALRERGAEISTPMSRIVLLLTSPWRRAAKAAVLWDYYCQRPSLASLSKARFIFYLRRDNICGFKLFKNSAKSKIET